MKTNELMIGNIVECSEGNPLYVNCIGYGEVSGIVKTFDDIYCLKEKASNLKPIPITEELLRKNGFDDDTGTLCFKYYCLNMEHHTVTVRGISNTPGRDWSVRIANNDAQTVASADVQYLHQLQNILNIMDIKLDLVV